jgi:hypothetical protein
MFDPPNRPYSNGISWGLRGFRVGRNQFGNWWVSVSLPFGFRYSKTLGKLNTANSLPNEPEKSLTQNRNTTSKNTNRLKWKNLK